MSATVRGSSSWSIWFCSNTSMAVGWIFGFGFPFLFFWDSTNATPCFSSIWDGVHKSSFCSHPSSTQNVFCQMFWQTSTATTSKIATATVEVCQFKRDVLYDSVAEHFFADRPHLQIFSQPCQLIHNPTFFWASENEGLLVALIFFAGIFFAHFHFHFALIRVDAGLLIWLLESVRKWDRARLRIRIKRNRNWLWLWKVQKGIYPCSLWTVSWLLCFSIHFFLNIFFY